MLAKWRLLLHPMKQRLRNWIYVAVYGFVQMRHPVRPNSVILATNRTATLTDNLRYILNGLDREKYHVRIFLLSSPSASWMSRFIMRLNFVAAMATTQYTLVDDFLPTVYAIRLRPGTRLIQVWHALGALKRVGFSRGGKYGGPASTSISHKNYTDVIVSSEPIRKDFAEAFGVSIDTVHATGAPRSDLFFDDDAQERSRTAVYSACPDLKGKRVILYAPTFRGRGKRTAYFPDGFIDLDRIYAALGEDDIFVLRLHPFVKDCVQIPHDYRDKIVDLSSYPEFNSLLLVSDLLITDYSSAIFDYSLMRRPVVFYVPDLDTYTAERGFYYDFSEYAYGPVARDLDCLISLLGTTAVDDEVLTVFHEKFLGACDGHATQRFLSTILADSKEPVYV